MDLNIHPPLPKRKDFRIGVLGAGFIVNDCHLVAYRKAGFNPVAIASRTKENAARVAQRHGIAKVCDGYDELLDDPSIEVLDIAVAPNAQLGLIKAACQRKTVKGILAQKPLGMNYHEAAEVVRACDAAGITLAVNQNMRYDQSIRAAKTLLDQGVLGEPIFGTIDMRAIPHWMPWQKELGWLTLRIMSIHHLDTFRYWFGDPEGIYCSVRTDPRTQFPHADGICTYILEYANGLRCVGIDDTWTGPAKEGCPSDLRIGWRIEGTNGLAIGDIGWCKEPFTTPSTMRYAAKGDKEFHQPRWAESWFPDAFIGPMAQLLIALETGSEPVISGRDNLKTMALVEAAYLSAREKVKVALTDITQAAETPKPVAAIKTEWLHEPGAETLALKKPGFFARLFSKPKMSVKSPPSLDERLSNFTPRAHQVLALARKEAAGFNHNFVGTEHLLLGLIKLGQGTAVDVLQKMGIDLEIVRTEVEKQVGPGPVQQVIGKIPYTPRVKKVLALAAKEAKTLNHNFVGTEHILLGLLREGDGVAARVLKRLNIDLDQTRQEILRELDPSFQMEDMPPRPEEPVSQVKQPPTNFTPGAQQILVLSRQEADRLNHNFVGTEHLLLGLIKLNQGVAVNVLQKMGVNLETARREVERYVGAGPQQKVSEKIPYTPRVKRVLSLAAKEAKALNHNFVGTEHILLGMIREDDGVAARVLKELGVELERTRQEILDELDPNQT